MSDWQDAESRAERAQDLLAQRRWGEALEELRAAIRLNPLIPEWHFNLGMALDELGRHEEAAEAYQQVVDMSPDDVEALGHLAAAQLRAGRHREAIETYERMEAIDASFEPCYCGRILAFAAVGDHEKAEEMFYTARQYQDDCPDCFHNIGVSLFARGQWDRALYCWRRVCDLDAAFPQVHLRIAEALWEKGELEEARRHYLEELRRQPGDVGTVLDLGLLLLDMRRMDEAGEKFRRAVEMAPDSAAARFHLGEWFALSGDDEQAEAQLGAALRLDPTCPGAHMRLAEIHLRRGRPLEAHDHLRAEMLLDSDDPATLDELANLLLDCGDDRAAAAVFRTLTQRRPDLACGWENLAIVEFRRGRWDAGMEASRRAIEADPRSVTARYNLATACEMLGRYDEALEWVAAALELAPSDVPLQRLRRRLQVLRLWRGLVRRLAFWRA